MEGAAALGIFGLLLAMLGGLVLVLWIFLPFIIIAKMNRIREAIERFHNALAKEITNRNPQ